MSIKPINIIDAEEPATWIQVLGYRRLDLFSWLVDANR